MLALFLTQIADRSGHYRASDVPRLEIILVDLLTALFARACDAQGAPPPERRTRMLRLRILAFVEQNLADPELGPVTVAAAHHVSVRYLHRLFEDEPESVAQLIRRKRLAGARRMLTEPAYAGLAVQEVAACWGFRHHAVFSRAFRDAFGMSPRAYRAAAAGSR